MHNIFIIDDFSKLLTGFQGIHNSCSFRRLCAVLNKSLKACVQLKKI
jgi:hypothetical protein